MKQKHIILLFLLLPFIHGCNNEDDINAIFSGTWKLNNFYTTSDWTDEDKRVPVYDPRNPEDKKILDMIIQSGKFTVKFSEGTFTGVADEKAFSGTWQANGKDNTVSIKITSGGSSSNVIGKKFIEAFKNAKFYRGNIIYLQLYPESKDSYIQFSRE